MHPERWLDIARQRLRSLLRSLRTKRELDRALGYIEGVEGGNP